MVKMKALRSFGVGGANEGKVRRGREFNADNEHRAKELEEHGLAYRLEVEMQPLPVGVDEIVSPVSANKAAQAGPFVSVGGTTGADAPASSSPLEHQPRRRRSARSKDEDLLS